MLSPPIGPGSFNTLHDRTFLRIQDTRWRCLQVQSRSDWDEHNHLQRPVRYIHGVRGGGGEHHLGVPDRTQDPRHPGWRYYWRGQKPSLDPHLWTDLTRNFSHLFKNVYEN